MSDGMGRELAYLSSHATNRYFIPNWGKVSRKVCKTRRFTPKSLNFYGFRAAKSDEKARF